MLGKGLESLIPPHQNSSAQQDGNKTDKFGAGQAPENKKTDAQPGGVQRQTEPPTQPRQQPQEAKIQHQHQQSLQPIQKKPRRPESIDSVFHIEVEKIKPNSQQPRRQFDEEALKDLASSIREFGIIQPIVVSKTEKETTDGTDVEYQLIAGERRWLASKMLGLERIPAIIRNIDLERERLELAVIENIQREDLNPIERARAFARLQDEFRLTQREIASRLGKSREVVANTVRLLDLPATIAEALEKNLISESHGRLLLSIADPAAQERIFRELLDKKMTTRDLKNRVRGTKTEIEKAQSEEIPPEMKILQEKLSAELGAPVSIESRGERGRITITFFSPEELRSIIDKFGPKED
ncbi:MAG: ParB/RepB/Spo0J family partition protein [Patescibacteria group bacterium]